MHTKHVVFISCGIFKEELEYLVKERGLDWEITFLDAALHVNFDKLKEQLLRALEDCKRGGVEARVVYGNCHPEIRKILETYGARKIAAGNCLQAMAGEEEVKRLNSEAKTFFLSAGWVNNWEKIFALGKEDFGFDFRKMFADYKRVVLFDTGVIPIDEEKVRRFVEFTGLPVERRMITLDRLFGLISAIAE